MKTLMLVRHAKSSWEHDVDDIKRPLNSRGTEDAPLVANDFKTFGFQPDAIYSSPATRALTTCKLFMDHMHLSKKLLEVKDELYDFGGEKVLRFIASLNDDYKNVMLFGHNPTFTSLINTLGNVRLDNLPTSGLALIEFDVDSWQAVKEGTTQMIITPKDLK